MVGIDGQSRRLELEKVTSVAWVLLHPRRRGGGEVGGKVEEEQARKVTRLALPEIERKKEGGEGSWHGNGLGREIS